MENPFKNIQKKSEAERKRLSKITAMVIFAIIVALFIVTGAGFGTRSSTSVKEAVLATGATSTKGLLEIFDEFFTSVKAGWQNIKGSVGGIQNVVNSDIVADMNTATLTEPYPTSTESTTSTNQ